MNKSAHPGRRLLRLALLAVALAALLAPAQPAAAGQVAGAGPAGLGSGGGPGEQGAQPAPPAQPAPATQAAPAVQRNSARRQALLAELEAAQAQGAYAEQTVGPLFNLGLLHQRQGRHEEAVAAFTRALQTLRVHSGLHNMNQEPLVEAIIASNQALGDQNALRKNYDYLYWLHRRNVGADPASLIPVVRRIAQWHMALYHAAPPGVAVAPLVAADVLHDKALALLPGDAPSEARIAVLYEAALVNYHLAQAVLDHRLSHRALREAMLPHGRGSPYLNETAVRQYYSEQSFFKGKRALQEIVAFYEQDLPATRAEYAQALIFMGDWFTASRRLWDGARLYRRAWAVLEDDKALLDRLFGAPQPIAPPRLPNEGRIGPAAGLAPAAAGDAPPVASACIDAVLDIPANGWPEKIRLRAVYPPAKTTQRERDEYAIAATRHRPRFQAGRPVATRDVALRYCGL